MKKTLIVGAVAVAATLIGCGIYSSPSDPPTTPRPTVSATTAPSGQPTKSPTAPPRTSAVPTATAATPGGGTGALSAVQRNAVADAEGYLGMQGFSRAGLIAQLSSDYGDGYTKADATKAVDSLRIDWNAQAVRAAKDYLENQSFSRKGLQEQLESPYGAQFTHAQAVYGVAHSGL